MDGLSKKVTLFCDVCGNDMFLSVDNITYELKNAPMETRIQCSDCKKIFTKAELIEVNEQIINANIDDFKKEIIEDFEKKLSKILKKWR